MTMVFRRSAPAAVVVLCFASSAFGQANATGRIFGRIDSEAGPLPGVTAVAQSPNLQQPLEVTTTPNGDYTLPFLPAGDYTVTFGLDGFRTTTETLRLAVGDTVTLNVRMQVGAEESVTVLGDAADAGLISSTPTVAMNHNAELVGQLPLDRTLRSTILLAPGVNDTGPDDAGSGSGRRLSISGAMTFENLYLVNGAVVNSSASGEGLPLYIEDAIQEITTSSSAISAEYGHFNGGVVNVVTKSGGDDPSGSFRMSFANDSWRATTPFGEPKADRTTPTYEATLGGPIQRGKLWFFLAGRHNDTTTARQTRFVSIPYEHVFRESRFEGKVTYTPYAAHTIRASYFTLDGQQTNAENGSSGGWMDLAGLSPLDDGQDLFATHYTGALSNRLFVEAQFSQRRQRVSFGSTDTDLITGTPHGDLARGFAGFGAAGFCSVCGDDRERDNQTILVKGNYFFSSEQLGSHDVIVGYDTLNNRFVENNYQTGSGYAIGSTGLIRDQAVFPELFPFQSLIFWVPTRTETLGSDLRVHSLFINDRAQLNRHLSLNLGLRYDRNSGRDSVRTRVATDSKWSPRLALTYSPDGTGRWGLTGGFSRYVSAVNSIRGNVASPGGQSDLFVYLYGGPPVNADPTAPTESLLSTPAANQILFDWFFANGGTSMFPVAAEVPAVDTAIDDTLRSPHVNEWTAGVRRTLGGQGEIRVDLVHRRYHDYYTERVDLSTGQVMDENGVTYDTRLFGNSDDLSRDYVALTTQFSYFPTSRLALGGHWTISQTEGNFEPERRNSLDASDLSSYPEYRDPAWNAPTGDLSLDQRHRLRVWSTYAVPITESRGSLTVGIIQSYDSGTPYGAVGDINPAPFVQNPGYVTPLLLTDYYFTPRDAFRTEGAAATDLAVTYAFVLDRLGSSTELFVQAQVLNLFDQGALTNGNRINLTTLTAFQGGAGPLVPFNPFTEMPVQGVNWDLGQQFGEAVDRFAYQSPRIFLFNFGVRF